MTAAPFEVPPGCPDIVTLGRHLWGDPTKQEKTELRFGAHESKVVGPAPTNTWFDHEAGTGGGYLELYKLRYGTLPEKKSDFPIPPGMARELGEPVAWWDYHDAEHRTVARVVRFHPPGKDKTYRQCRPNGAGWRWKMDRVQIPLYHLPELLDAPVGAVIHITEGEKHADLIREWGYYATTNAGGAKKFRADHAAMLATFDCVILPDNDDAGREHASVVAAALRAAGCDSIRIAALPGLPPKGDVIDWARNGGTAEKFEQISTEASPYYAHEREAEHEKAAEAGDGALGSDEALGIWDAGDDDYIIPPRGWLLGTTFCRRFLSSLVADGGVGKTALRLAQLISLAIGRSLTGEHVFQRCRVLVLSLEDDKDELRRRVHAVLRHHNITTTEVRGWLFLSAPKGLRLAEMKDGTPAAGALEGLLRNAVIRRNIDAVSLDPFVKSHGLEENSNGAIDFVCTLLAKIAIDHNLAVDLPHHTKKGIGGPGDADRSRGASAMKDAARLVYTLTPMSSEEATQFGLGESDRRSLIRLDSGKVNLAPLSSDATWFRLVGVPLDNGGGIYPAGDNVQTVEPWHPPSAWACLDHPLLNRILDDIEGGMPNGSRYSGAPKAEDRAAWQVVVTHAPDKTEKQAREIIRTWIKSGTLYTEDYEDPNQRKVRAGLRVNAGKRPS